MWNFQRIDPVKPLLVQKYIAFVGSGGKTSLMEYMADELLKQGRTVAITTTTKILAKAPYVLLEDGFNVREIMAFARVGKNIEQGKLTAIGFEEVEKLGSIYDVVLVEADGAKGKPLKFPASHEPVIPPFSQKIFLICGLDGLFKRVDEAIFRWELFCEATGISGDARVTQQVFLRLFADDIILKGVDKEKCTIILSKYDMLGAKKEAMKAGEEIITGTGIEEVIIASINFKVFYGITKSSR